MTFPNIKTLVRRLWNLMCRNQELVTRLRCLGWVKSSIFPDLLKLAQRHHHFRDQ